MTEQQAILTINAGSSSIKFALFPLTQTISPDAEVSGQIDGIGADVTKLIAKNRDGEKIADQIIAGDKVSHDLAFDALLKWFQATQSGWQIVAVGHRVVHGGERYSKPTLIDDAVLNHLIGFIPLAPLHEPHNVAGIKALQALLRAGFSRAVKFGGVYGPPEHARKLPVRPCHNLPTVSYQPYH